MKEQLVMGLTPQYVQMLIRFAICVVVNWIIIDRLYYRKSKRRDFYFTFMLISVSIFFLVFFMIFVLEDMKGKAGIGLGIGLFGIFSIMRYRTDTMPVREMTYLFIIISLAVVNALASSMRIEELIFTNVLVIIAIILCEWRLKTDSVKLIQYDKIDLITPDKREELVDDLKKRTGLDITKVEVGAIDMLRDMTVLRVHYRSTDKGSNSVDRMTKIPKEDLR
ncbi:MAG: DUF4956 domain-containing protein [Muribaculaceae bacterium]|nr:DUF4956 domain-containing protein [Muribaculaceae bacterium]MBR6489491.1 DUF4956 domain-containing protein [Muribaculaceae bacterium]